MPAWLVDLFARYGYAVVFVGVLLENAGLPVPGETALLAGAALSRSGTLFLPWVVATAIVGAILGDNIGFMIGRRGGRALVERFGPKIGLTPPRLEQFDAFFERHGAKTVFIARFVTGLRVFGAVGYFLAYSWETLEEWIGRSGLALLAVAAVIAIVAGLRRRRAAA